MIAHFKVCFIVLFLIYTSTVQADNKTKLYVGVGFADASISMDTVNYTYVSTNLISDDVYSDIEKETKSQILLIGYQFNKYYGIESSFQKFSEFGYRRESTYTQNLNTANEYTNNLNLIRNDSVSGLTISNIGYLPLNNMFSLTGALGIFFSQVDSTESHTNILSSGTHVFDTGEIKSKFVSILGVGILANVGRNFGVKLDLNRYGKFSDLSTESFITCVSFAVVYFLD